ncbi:hypothetical protein ACC691_38065, partial [Rhizobium johnstonii]|uniref:hypothetical protein n=1 Tax=Rhizobium johnstonii TaxID=3019933 RepID=UPI003F99B683
MNHTAPRSLTRRLVAAGSIAALAALSVTACSTGSSGSGSSDSADGDVGVSLIVKTTSNPFFVAMEDGAKK